MSSEDSKSLIELQARNWDKEQKLAIAQLANVALSRLHPTITHDWSRPWQERIYTYLEVTFNDLATCQLSTDQAVQVVTSRIRDIRIDILVDFLAVAMDMDHQGADSTKTTAMVYDARARQFLFQLAYTMKLDLADVAAVERSIAQQMYFALQENSKEKDPNLEDRAAIMDQSAKKAMTETNTKKKAMRWLATGAGVLGGGALIALTGGLAAPLLAPLLVGITGATFFATAGGVALVTSLFGLTGGGLAGWKMHRRMQGLQEFQFQQILSDADLPPIPTLQCTICISGYYLHEKDEFRTPWERGFSKAKNFNDIYCLQYESDALLDLGIAFRKFVKNQALRYAGLEVAKQTALNAFFAAMALPATLLKIADVIDNPWLIAADRSRRAGVVLADILEQRVQGNRPCSLASEADKR
ncbi:hypothetical protein VTP01DRAFT_4150 [Rhizomucor pusillus]|uniref:uncharacterized protein n=1 Tax=Rhizomucor pusillus TaxID=4840 RepID=UPI0037449A58